MRLPRYFSVVVIFITVLIGACNSAEQKPPAVATANKPIPAQQPPNDGIRRITVQEAQDLLIRNQAVMIDVRNQAAYDSGHIKGAKLIPINEIQNHTSELPKDKTIVTYCS
jgi:predicted sulfurtransferase